MTARTKKPAPRAPLGVASDIAAPDGARLRRLARAGFAGADACPLLGVDLDVGLRANEWLRPVQLGAEVVCALAAAIAESGVSPDALERAAARIREWSES
jgi:hypothetical protein